MKKANFWATQINEDDKRSYRFFADAVQFEQLTGISGMKFGTSGNIVCAEVKQDGDMQFTEMEIEHNINGEDLYLNSTGVLSFDPSTILLSFKCAYTVPGAAPTGKVMVILSRDKFNTKHYDFAANELKDLEYFAKKSCSDNFDEDDYEGALGFVCQLAKKIVKA